VVVVVGSGCDVEVDPVLVVEDRNLDWNMVVLVGSLIVRLGIIAVLVCALLAEVGFKSRPMFESGRVNGRRPPSNTTRSGRAAWIDVVVEVGC
jgi:hypothetical protein